MDGRKRTVQIKFRVTEAERDLILEKMKLVPTRNRRLKRKSKLSGAIKSLVESPVLGIISHENRKGEPLPGWSCP